MTKIIKILIVVTACTSLMSCGMLMQGGSIVAEQYIACCNNNHSDPLGLADEARTWQHSNAGKGLLLAEWGLEIVDGFTKKDLSNVTGIVKNTRNAYIEDPNTDNNHTTAIVGLLAHAGAQTGVYFEDRNREWNDRLEKYYEAEMHAKDPSHPDYDPYFQYRFIIDSKHKKITRRSDNELMQLIRDAQTEQTDKDLIRYGIISEAEFNAKYGTPELKAENYDSYQNLCQELGLQKHNKRYANHTTSTTEVSASTNNQSNKPTSSNLSTHTNNDDAIINNTIEQINSTVVDNYTFDTYTLSAEQKLELDYLAGLLKSNESIQVTIVGHTCHIGTDRANASVGLKRASHAKQYLIDCGIEESRIRTETVGATEPLSDKKDLNSRLANRRISFKAVKK